MKRLVVDVEDAIADSIQDKSILLNVTVSAYLRQIITDDLLGNNALDFKAIKKALCGNNGFWSAMFSSIKKTKNEKGEVEKDTKGVYSSKYYDLKAKYEGKIKGESFEEYYNYFKGKGKSDEELEITLKMFPN